MAEFKLQLINQVDLQFWHFMAKINFHRTFKRSGIKDSSWSRNNLAKANDLLQR